MGEHVIERTNAGFGVMVSGQRKKKMTAKIMHLSAPGPSYWSWRCLRCGERVTDHASLLRLVWNRLTGQAHD